MFPKIVHLLVGLNRATNKTQRVGRAHRLGCRTSLPMQVIWVFVFPIAPSSKAGFSLWFHLPRCHVWYNVLSHSHSCRSSSGAVGACLFSFGPERGASIWPWEPVRRATSGERRGFGAAVAFWALCVLNSHGWLKTGAHPKWLDWHWCHFEYLRVPWSKHSVTWGWCGRPSA